MSSSVPLGWLFSQVGHRLLTFVGKCLACFQRVVRVYALARSGLVCVGGILVELSRRVLGLDRNTIHSVLVVGQLLVELRVRAYRLVR